MLRKILTSYKPYCIIPIPEDYMNRPIEILILPFDDNTTDDIKYWTKDELQKLSLFPSFDFNNDTEDYSKW